ncbi:hypothetical protein CUN46_00220 [Enterococcus faecium]|uniref:DUF1642 domain-containing protein n=1 Tax=Enterococcus faecium TaxID=1352 RepID=UPI000CF054E0|nr:DUF1642 domain-containing protein [Enterococcus faecium]PQC64170.1 hypothetical protein CUN46_00220 [Enterococcus faecium]HAQ4565347.1 DUF1642 domain-containing protein [Enterococcus faecium]
MNKQELINELARHASCLEDFRGITGHCDGKYEAYEIAIELAKQLDEPQKPVVPKFVAEYLNYCMANEWTLEEALTTGKFQFPEYLYKAVDWLNDSMNQNIFARAWLYGYEVEKEPQYMVPLLTDKEGNKKILVERRESTTSFGIMRMRTTGMSC